MKGNLMDPRFAFGTNEDIDAAAIKKEKALATVNEADASATTLRVNRTIGPTEARLRARNKESWTTSTKGWSDFFGRFTTHTKR